MALLVRGKNLVKHRFCRGCTKNPPSPLNRATKTTNGEGMTFGYTLAELRAKRDEGLVEDGFVIIQ